MFLVIHINYVIVVVLELINKKWLRVRSSVRVWLCVFWSEKFQGQIYYIYLIDLN